MQYQIVSLNILIQLQNEDEVRHSTGNISNEIISLHLYGSIQSIILLSFILVVFSDMYLNHVHHVQ